jgi:RNA 3'-terminal phosphate cyclase-like protein
MLRFRGCEHFRQRITLACLSGKPIRIDDIRKEDEAPGLRGFEASLLRLLEKVSNGCVVEINETGAGVHASHALSLCAACAQLDA